jgi:hypothetical protein
MLAHAGGSGYLARRRSATRPSRPTLAVLQRRIAHISADALARRHGLRKRDPPITPAMNSTNRGLSNTPGMMINHCVQIETLPMARCPRRTSSAILRRGPLTSC